MKIISIRFANLNSLPGPYLIRFDKAPLVDTGLFAITGPTGAGKSTLLDAIAVGLYGRVPRHDRQVGEMVSRHKPYAYAEVEFEVHETNADTGATERVRYRSRWEVKRKTRGEDKGSLSQDVMSLVRGHFPEPTPEVAKPDPVWEAVVSGKEAVPLKVGELSGLDFGQFEQAVLLSQGKFARFLHAPEKERSALLEKMTNVGIYSRLSVAAFEKAKAEERQTELLAATLHATRLLPDEERQRLTDLLDALHEDAEMTYEHQQELNACLAWRTRVDQLENQAAEATREAAALHATSEQLQPDFERLAQHERAAQLRLPLSLAEAARRELTRDEDELAQLHQQLPALTKAAAEAAAAHQAATQAQAAAQAEADHLRPVLQEAQRQDAGIAAAHSQLAKNRTAHATATQALAADQAAWHQHAAELTDLTRQQTALEAWLLAHNHETALDQALAEIKRDLLELAEVTEKLARLETEQEQLLKQLATATTERNRDQQAAEEATRQQQALTAQSRPHEQERTQLLAGTQPADLTRAAADLTTRLHVVQRLLPQAQAADQHAHQAAELAQAHATEAAAMEPAAAAFAHLETRLADAQHLLDSYERERRLQQALADLDAYRHQLQPGVPCPLCGALEHAYAADFQADADEQEQRTTQQKYALQSLEKELRQADHDLVRRRTEQQQRLTRQAEAEAAEAAARHQAAELAASLTPALPTEPAAIEQALAETTAAQQAATAHCAHLADLDQALAALRTSHDEAQTTAQAAARRATEAEHQLQLIQRDLAALKNELTEEREAAANYRAEVQGKLAPHHLALPASTPYNGLLATLGERADTFRQQQQHLAQVQQARLRQQTEHDTRAADLGQREAALHTAAASLATELATLEAAQAARQTTYPGPDPAAAEEVLHQATRQLSQAAAQAHEAQARQQQALASTTERLHQRQTDLARHQTDFAARQTELAAALTAAGFGTDDEAEALLLPLPEAERLAQQRQQHHTRFQASQQLATRLTADLARVHEAALTPLSTEALTTELKQLATENDSLQQRLGAAASQLTQDDTARQQQADGVRELLKRQQEQTRWQDLADHIGSARGDKFSRFAQGLTLTHLARLANQRLRQLTSRYSIFKPTTSDLELRIIDHDQADTVRPMASLSGGESFLVSLALALGLSELAGHKARIESLFIDEGFGSLDPDSLNMALDALERLQHSGKMIGVISHVADLKDRIGTQIRVQPGAGGNSTVRVVDVAGRETRCEA
ncbi:MAG: SbcC/MukB-like Walker B domain-containing protein [Janthinobacterium lividum]